MNQTATDANTGFDQLIKEYYQAWFRFHPQQAVDCGQDQFAGELAPFSNSRMGALQSLHEGLLSSLEEMDYQALDADRRLDFDVLIGQVYLERQAMLNFDWRFRDPQAYLPLDAINQLLQRPVAGFARALSSRLKAAPDYLWQAQQLMRQAPEHIPPQWLEQAVIAARAGDEFINTLANHPKVQDAIGREPYLVQEIEAARKAVLGYAGFLERDIGAQAQGEAACGAHRFSKLLQLNHGLSINHQQLYAFGLKLAEQTYTELKQQCRELAGHEDIAELNQRLRADHPASGALLAVYRESMQNAREFVARQNLVSLPETEALDVVETPLFLRHQIPFAAYMPPMVSDSGQQGFYYVTPAADEDALGEHNFLSIGHICVHEAYPGHHLQFATANLNPASRSWPRLINTSSTLYEGWALYCEQLMVEQGMLDQPLNRFILLKDRLWRALRVLIDVDLHVNQISQDQAVRTLCGRLGFTEQQARADVAWYTHAPTVPMGYALGWTMINALRDEQMAAGSFDLCRFHDKLLGSGSIALASVIRHQFGQKSLDHVMSALVV